MAVTVATISAPRKWRAIAIATLVLTAAFWSLLAGLVALGSDEPGGPAPAPAVAIGLVLVPVAFAVLAWLSATPRPRRAVVHAVALFLAVGILVSAFAADAVTGFVAGAAAGALCVLPADDGHSVRARVLAVVVAALYSYILVRLAGAFALLFVPIFPFTGIGVADHIVESRRSRT